MPDRQTSAPRYSKRHASFNSPREVPLPSPTAVYPDNSNPFSFSSSNLPSPSAPRLEHDLRSSPSSSRPRSPASPSQRPFLPPDSPRRLPLNKDSMINRDSSRSNSPTSPSIQSRLLSPRPSALPDSSATASGIPFPDPSSHPRQSPPPPSHPPLMSSNWIDSNSSASLPLPSQIPFHALPKLNLLANPPMLSPSPPPPASDLHSSDLRAPATPSLPSSSTDVASLLPTDRSAFRCPSADQVTSSSSSSSSGSADSGATSSSSLITESSAPLSDKLSSDPSLAPEHSPSHTHARPISPFRAPQPPPPQPTRSVFDFTTAMGRFMTSHTAPSYNPPDPPVVLPPEPGDDMTQSFSLPHAPHFPFLSHAPPPPDSWIEVETTLSEYKLHVRLPGFSREGITLATKRRRILHVVADRWDNGGGHFERRISFGYDADLVQVRAEFDGTMLRILVPRRVSPVTLHTPRTGSTSLS